jgi:hypothetical protein
MKKTITHKPKSKRYKVKSWKQRHIIRKNMATVPEKWLNRELKGFIGVSMTKQGADKIKEIVKKFDYDKDQAKEVIADALWYSDEDFWRIHSKKAYSSNPKEEEKFTIELDTPPGYPRPGDIFPDVIKGTGLSEDDFEQTGRFFGNWTWELKPGKEDAYKKARPIIKERISKLHPNTIRYGSW